MQLQPIANNYIVYAPEYYILFACALVAAVWSDCLTLVLLVCGLFALVLYFFQGASHIRRGPIDSSALYCPCDGVVAAIVPHARYTQICVFLNVYNTHVQYAPFACTVKIIQHTPGSFHPAYLLTKSQYNERTEYVLSNPVFGDVLFVQIAGQLARRIVSFVKPEQSLAPLEPLGLIKLGSRCDIYVPNEATIHKSVGDRARIGDILATK